MPLARLVSCSAVLVMLSISVVGCATSSKDEPAQSAAVPPPTTASAGDAALSCDPQTPEQIAAKAPPVCYKVLGVPVVGPGLAPK